MKQLIAVISATNYAATWTTIKWNGPGSRSTWLLAGSATGLVRIWDISSARKKDKYGDALSRAAFETMCSDYSN